METLNIEVIKARQKKVADDFSAVEAEIREIEEMEQQLARKKGKKNVELFRLQGEHRVLNDLLKEPEEKDTVPGEEVKQ